LVIVFLGALVAGEVGCVIGALRFTARLQPYFRRFIEEHGHEISPAAKSIAPANAGMASLLPTCLNIRRCLLE
jgi:hypothetical protein